MSKEAAGPTRECGFCGKGHACYPKNRTIADGFGSEWSKCERDECGLEIVRPGKVQCWCDDGRQTPNGACEVA